MKSIRIKVLVGVTASLALGLAGLLAVLHVTFVKNSEVIAQDSVTGAHKLFSILSDREVSKMKAIGDTLLSNREVGDALAAGNRDRLLELTAPTYAGLRQEGITNWIFCTPEKEKTALLRVHDPAKFGDTVNRFLYNEAIRTHAPVSGNELGKTGFVFRVMRPYFDSKKQVIGYVEFGEEIGHFIREMKEQTGDDYGLLLKKQNLDRRSWAESMAAIKQRDNWDDNPDVVVADKTTSHGNIIRFSGDLAEVPDEGKTLERFEDGASVRLRGIFPVRDASNAKIGGMFVVHDITASYQSLRVTQNLLMLVVFAVLIAIAVGLLSLLTKLVFRRLDRIITVVTRVVGGDYEKEIEVTSQDEVGQFENLFEQFRLIFVDLLNQVRELQAK